MTKLKTHKDLDVWKDGIAITLLIYEIVKTFPAEEKYGLTDQIKRASVSIPSNIAEGASRNTKKEFLHYLGIALGSLSELEMLEIQRYKMLALVKSIRKTLN